MLTQSNNILILASISTLTLHIQAEKKMAVNIFDVIRPFRFSFFIITCQCDVRLLRSEFHYVQSAFKLT